MTFTCTAVREKLLECRGDTGSDEPGLSVHLDECSECAEFARRTKALVALLSALPQRPAPSELAGLVVAATQAGHRQERAAKALGELSRLPVPSELEVVALDDGPVDEDRPRDLPLDIPLDIPLGAKAPSVLDRLVDQDLRDPAAAISRRFTSRLDRRRAPGVLRERVAGGLRTILPPRRMRLLLPMAAGVALLVLASVRFFRGESQVEVASDDFQVVYESSLGSMDPMARGMLSGLTGGVVDVQATSGTQTDGGAR